MKIYTELKIRKVISTKLIKMFKKLQKTDPELFEKQYPPGQRNLMIEVGPKSDDVIRDELLNLVVMNNQ